MWKIIGNLLVTGLTFCMIGGFLILLAFYHYASDLPDYSQLADYQPATVTRLYAGDGKLLAEYAREKRIFVPLSAMPRRVIYAFLSAEDKNFYQHSGVDIYGIARAMKENVSNLGGNKSMVGGSTITQQVVKNFLLTNERSIERKIKEAILAFRISNTYSKDRILELYLNQIFLGFRSYGVAAAALNYFNKSLDDLTIEEAAFLASLPKGPSNYDPRRFYDRAKARRDWVIKRMLEDGYITEQEYMASVSLPIIVRQRDEDEVTRADYFAEEVRRTLVAMYGEKGLYEGGLSVRTTLDPVMQAFAEKALRATLVQYDRRHGWRGPLGHLPVTGDWAAGLKALPRDKIYLFDKQQLAVVLSVSEDKATIGLEDGKRGTISIEQLHWAQKPAAEQTLSGVAVSKVSQVLMSGDVIVAVPMDEKAGTYDLFQIPEVNGALVAMDPHTGRVLAIAGGYGEGGTEFNRATQAKRQPGSSFKPFVYLAALEHGYTPSSIVIDAPVELSQGAGLPVWKPQNYHNDFLGPATLRTGVEKSRNAMTVRLTQYIGVDNVIRVAKRFGIYDQVPRNFSIVLGSAETTVLRMTNAYAMLVNGGKLVQGSLIERIQDRNGKTIYRRDMRNCTACAMLNNGPSLNNDVPPLPEDNRPQVADPRVAYQMVSILEGVVQRGTGVRAKEVGKPLAGKTGTTNDSLDTWFVGFSPDLVAGVFVGFDKPKTLGKKETGASAALPGFIDFMKSALADKPAKPFRIPSGIKLVKVNHDTGLPPGEETDPNKIIYEAFLTGDKAVIPPTPGEPEPSAEDKAKDDARQAAPPVPGEGRGTNAESLPWLDQQNQEYPAQNEPPAVSVDGQLPPQQIPPPPPMQRRAPPSNMPYSTPPVNNVPPQPYRPSVPAPAPSSPVSGTGEMY